MAVASIESRVTELRFLEGVEKVEHVAYSIGDQFWVRFNRPIDFGKLDAIVNKHGYRMVRFASLPSKLPRSLAEMLWDGITHVIVKNISGWSSFTSSLGFEPDGIAKVGVDLHGPYELFMAMNEEGVQILYEYLGLKYVPPPSPPAQPKPAAPAAARPTPPVAPPRPAGAQPLTPAISPPLGQPQQAKPLTQQAPPLPVATPAAAKTVPPASQRAVPAASTPAGTSTGSTPAQAVPVTEKNQPQDTPAATKPQPKKETDAQMSSQAG